MTYKSNEPYNDLPLLPPASPIETTRVLRRCISAGRALAELKGAGALIPNQAILINAIPLQEARLSSEIENIVTTQDQLFRAAVEPPSSLDPATKEVLRYRTALRQGYDALRRGLPLGIDMLLEVCGVLRESPACLRDEEPVINPSSLVRWRIRNRRPVPAGRAGEALPGRDCPNLLDCYEGEQGGGNI